ETSFVKQGRKTPGVQRQYLGTVGKKQNGIVTVHLAYAADDFHCLSMGGNEALAFRRNLQVYYCGWKTIELLHIHVLISSTISCGRRSTANRCWPDRWEFDCGSWFGKFVEPTTSRFCRGMCLGIMCIFWFPRRRTCRPARSCST